MNNIRSIPRFHRGFTLIEMMIALSIICILVYVMMPMATTGAAQFQINAEISSLQTMANAIQSSFNSADFENTNISAVLTDIPPGVDATNFTTSTNLTTLPSTTNTYDWFAKVARMQGYTPQVGVAPDAVDQPAIYKLLVNHYGNMRMLFVGPSENTQQRFLLVSLMAPAGELVLPTFQNTAAWFNDIWNNTWNNSSTIPSDWTGWLTAPQVAAWNPPGGSACWRLVVIPITVRRFTILGTDTHPTDNAWIYYNGNTYALHSGGDNQLGYLPADSGVTTVPSAAMGILSGRLITVTRGATESTATQVQQFYLTDFGQVVIQ